MPPKEKTPLNVRLNNLLAQYTPSTIQPMHNIRYASGTFGTSFLRRLAIHQPKILIFSYATQPTNTTTLFKVQN